MFSFLKTLGRMFDSQDAGKSQKKYSDQELIQWATGCMLEGLPDDFYQARLLCVRFPNPGKPGCWIVSINHDVMLTAESDYERFHPADDLYPTQCVEMLLDGKEWQEATMIFNKEKTSFKWI
ncbi:hypothetical protein [Cedecea sp. NFIX57]|uniref:hypothetical protein n=1 Tax=Cedecea sp. NFIX57 TaxID=1566286 RepID=UPI000A0CCFB4|nr:hypothetical protein [Cedecea sp. NFIX57]SMG30238.1 hypothetical protein SAMN03159353_1006202 [Cedecea sp. NFIX57]